MKGATYKTQAHFGPDSTKTEKGRAAIIAGGPSLARKDVALVEKAGALIIGINNAYQICKRLDILYACDTKWWRHHYKNTPASVAKYSLKKDGADAGFPGVVQMERGPRNGLSKQWPILCTGGNSGHQAINLAYLLGYKKILLLGFDMGLEGKKTHWHGDHAFKGCTNPSFGTFERWKKDFQILSQYLHQEGIEIINATRKTALTCFPQVRLEDAL